MRFAPIPAHPADAEGDLFSLTTEYRQRRAMSQLTELSTTAPLESPTRRNWVWYGYQLFFRVFFSIWLGYRARGVEKIPRTGGGLLLINHQSYLDPLMVGLPLTRPISYLARDDLFRIPLVGWVLRHTYVMPISREAASIAVIRETVRRMEHGYLCGIFPEGTRSPDGKVGELKPGFVALARRVALPIYPIGIAGAFQALGRGSWFLKPRRVCVVYGDPIPQEQVQALSQKGREAELVALVRQRIMDCQEEAERWRRGE
jgi:1-acyl-sn-glycerol-3-phosphate acyltransferase